MTNKRYFFVVDFETGGLDPQKHDPVQIAVQVLDPKTLKPVSSFVSYMKASPERVSPEALAIHGISLDTLAEAPEPEVVFEAMVEFLRPYQQGLFVAHNAKFDYDFMVAWAAKCAFEGFRLNQVFDYRLICTAQLAFEKWVLHDQTMQRVKLEDITKALKITHAKAHDALSDVEATGEVLRRALRKSFTFRLIRGLRQSVQLRRLSAVLDSLRSVY